MTSYTLHTSQIKNVDNNQLYVSVVKSRHSKEVGKKMQKKDGQYQYGTITFYECDIASIVGTPQNDWLKLEVTLK